MRKGHQKRLTEVPVEDGGSLRTLYRMPVVFSTHK